MVQNIGTVTCKISVWEVLRPCQLLSVHVLRIWKMQNIMSSNNHFNAILYNTNYLNAFWGTTDHFKLNTVCCSYNFRLKLVWLHDSIDKLKLFFFLLSVLLVCFTEIYLESNDLLKSLKDCLLMSRSIANSFMLPFLNHYLVPLLAPLSPNSSHSSQYPSAAFSKGNLPSRCTIIEDSAVLI